MPQILYGIYTDSAWIHYLVLHELSLLLPLAAAGFNLINLKFHFLLEPVSLLVTHHTCMLLYYLDLLLGCYLDLLLGCYLGATTLCAFSILFVFHFWFKYGYYCANIWVRLIWFAWLARKKGIMNIYIYIWSYMCVLIHTWFTLCIILAYACSYCAHLMILA
jgi:hypothetical protein